MFIDLGDVESRMGNLNLTDTQANALINDAIARATAEISLRLNAVRTSEKNYMVRANKENGS